MLDKNGKRFYNHELTEIENLADPSLARQPDGIGSLEAKRDSLKGPGSPSQTHTPKSAAFSGPGADPNLSVLDIVRKHLSVKPAGAREVVDPPKQSEIP